MTETQARGPYAKSAERRARIVAAAVEVFGEAGYWNGSLRDVAVRAGISQPGLMHHFPSKTELLLAVLAHRDQSWDEAIGGGRASGLDLIRGIAGLVERNASQPQLTALFAVLAAEATAPEHPAHDYFVQRTAAVFERLHAAFVEASDAGELVAGTEPASAAYRLMALMDGLQVLWLYSPSVDMVAEVRTFLAGVLRSPL